MSKKKLENPFSEWPKTRVLKDGGVQLTGKYIQPGLESRADAFFGIMAIGLSIYAAAVVGDVSIGLVVLLVCMAAWYIAVRPLMNGMFGRNLNIKIYPDRITLPGSFRAKNYSRKIPIEFRVEQHIKALNDRTKKRIFANALEVVMQYGEKRVSLAAMPAKYIEKARALVFRLQGVCYNIDEAIKMIDEGNAQHSVRESEFGPAKPVR